MKRYNSKIGIGILLFLITVFGGTTIFLIYSQAWSGIAINAVTIIFITYLYLNTYYTIIGAQLFVKSGFLVNETIEISAITKITKTKNLISSPALSLDRLEVFYSNSTVIISPKDKLEFINHLQKINPDIETD
ncbi:MAG: PH domain-containing protein [Cellulophaga sp.]